MSLLKTAPLLAAAIAIALATPGCSLFHHHDKPPKSAYKIIPVGDRNPGIIDTPEIIKNTPTQRVEVESGPVVPQ